MKCLDENCLEEAVERGEMYEGVPIRECSKGHRTGLINVEAESSVKVA